jgi:hypothetical protein
VLCAMALKSDNGRQNTTHYRLPGTVSTCAVHEEALRANVRTPSGHPAAQAQAQQLRRRGGCRAGEVLAVLFRSSQRSRRPSGP